MKTILEILSVENFIEMLKEELNNSENENKKMLKAELRYQKNVLSKLKSKLRKISAINPVLV